MRASIGRFLVHPIFWFCTLAAFSISLWALATGHQDHPIRSDGWGYYLHLPATFIYGDLNLKFLENPDLPPTLAYYRFPDGTFQGLYPTASGLRDKYAAGVAVMQAPFFLATLAVARPVLGQVTGFEQPFQLVGAFGGAFYFGLGCYLLFKTARLRYGPLTSGLALASVVFGTNVLLYASFDSLFSHVYGFCLVAGLLYLSLSRVERGGPPSIGEFLTFGLVAGLAVAVRPTNMVFCLLFLLFVRDTSLRPAAIGTLVALIGAVIGALPQMLVWWVTTGQPIFYSYTGSGFFFLDPALYTFLFSVVKGAFFWHPTVLIGIVALALQLGSRRFEAALMLAIVALAIYIGASWVDPSFGGSFGNRQLVETTALFVLPFACLFERLRNPGRWIAAGVGALLVFVNFVQFHGYMTGRLPYDGTTREQYVGFWRRFAGS